jgi:hypothetical protein
MGSQSERVTLSLTALFDARYCTNSGGVALGSESHHI